MLSNCTVPCVTLIVPVLLPSADDFQRAGPCLRSALPFPARPPDSVRLVAVLMVTSSLSVTVPADVCAFVVTFQVTFVEADRAGPQGGRVVSFENAAGDARAAAARAGEACWNCRAPECRNRSWSGCRCRRSNRR